tara:strand:+ start:1209 stop:1463 length:255 start_codon:yes stop_codon:yes gene_type:complete
MKNIILIPCINFIFGNIESENYFSKDSIDKEKLEEVSNYNIELSRSSIKSIALEDAKKSHHTILWGIVWYSWFYIWYWIWNNDW